MEIAVLAGAGVVPPIEIVGKIKGAEVYGILMDYTALCVIFILYINLTLEILNRTEIPVAVIRIAQAVSIRVFHFSQEAAVIGQMDAAPYAVRHRSDIVTAVGERKAAGAVGHALELVTVILEGQRIPTKIDDAQNTAAIVEAVDRPRLIRHGITAACLHQRVITAGVKAAVKADWEIKRNGSRQMGDHGTAVKLQRIGEVGRPAAAKPVIFICVDRFVVTCKFQIILAVQRKVTVQKIKLAGAEKRAFARWGNLYAQSAKMTYDPPMFLKLNSVISLAISLTGTLVMYYMSVRAGLSVADYYAFNTAYGMVSGAFLSLAGIALSAAQIRPILTMVQPFFDAVPEVSDGKQVIERLSGGIELNNVSFRYNENMPLILDDLSLKIRPGQYVAIVGRTGCGKSTLLRLLLGFEKPQKGAIYYDGKDLERIDLRSLRRRIGVVMQNGKLFQGDIYSNIVISAPWLSQQDAWEAAELTGIAEDIRRMPMGMNTVISEGSGGISGGQRQRLMIARAIAPKPKILMFDEATSALDNITQKKVSESLDRLKCTRIVIAHRLSTIRQCDRILVLDHGRIVEDGTYDELIAANGFFAELVARQRLDDVPDAAL